MSNEKKIENPKRRKDKDNPYTIKQRNGRFYLAFKDGQGVFHKFEINKALYNEFDDFELEDLSHLNELDRHLDKASRTETEMSTRVICRADVLEDIVMDHAELEELHRAIAALPEPHQHRLRLYYFDHWTYAQIAEQDGCTAMPVKRSIDRAIEKLEKFFEDRGYF